MDSQDSSVSGQLAETRVDISSEGKIADTASQDRGTPTEDMPTPVVIEGYQALLVAAQKGDWKSAEKFLNEHGEAMTAVIMTVVNEPVSVLDVAILASQDQLVKNLIKHFPPTDKDFDFSIPLKKAASTGRKRMVEALVNKLDAKSESVYHAISNATTFAPKQKEVIWCLAKRTERPPIEHTMSGLAKAGHLDIALYLAHRYQVSTSSEENKFILECLAKMESNFRSGARLNFWEKSIDKFIGIPLCLVDTSFDNSKETKTSQAKGFKISLSTYATMPAFLTKRTGLRHKCSLKFANRVLSEMKKQMETPKLLKLLPSIVLDAASRGISEIVKSSFEHFPELTWNENFIEKLMKNVVKGRHVELFRLVNGPSTIPLLTDEMRRELMNVLVEWSETCLPKDVSGAPFLMQRELQWFMVLQDMSDPSSKSLQIKNILSRINSTSKSLKLSEDKKSYWDEFVDKRKKLLEEAGQWMKHTSSSCSLVSTLIITVAFATAFTAPGKDHRDMGIEISDKKSSFMVFAVANALALFSSVTATLMFLAILTSRYGAEDFLNSLPTKMILGLTFLFLSLAFMLVAFGSALTIVLGKTVDWIYIPITFLAAIPVVLSAILHLPLYIEMVESTYWPRLYRSLKLWE